MTELRKTRRTIALQLLNWGARRLYRIFPDLSSPFALDSCTVIAAQVAIIPSPRVLELAQAQIKELGDLCCFCKVTV